MVGAFPTTSACSVGWGGGQRGEVPLEPTGGPQGNAQAVCTTEGQSIGLAWTPALQPTGSLGGSRSGRWGGERAEHVSRGVGGTPKW